MRLFAGLAMLAMAFGGPIGTAQPAPPTSITAMAEVRSEARAEVPAIAPETPVAPIAPVTVPVLIAASTVLLVAGVALRVRAERAPPAV